MSYNKRLFGFIGVLLLLLVLFLGITSRYYFIAPKKAVEDAVASEQTFSDIRYNAGYTTKKFSISMGRNKLSQKQLSDHLQLYAGYVAKRNEIAESLSVVKKDNVNPSYSVFRGLKVGETFARNGALLHELYFENIGTGTQMEELTQKFIIDNFGSIDSFKQDLMATALSARGWAITCYNLDDQHVCNYLLDAHNERVPVLTVPLLVIDTYEHAYMIDFGIDRKTYLAILWENINWDVVEARVKRWAISG